MTAQKTGSVRHFALAHLTIEAPLVAWIPAVWLACVGLVYVVVSIVTAIA